MTKEKRQKDFDELDDFWELDAMLPPKATPPPRPADVDTVEVSLGEKDTKKGLERYYAPSIGDRSVPPSSETAPQADTGKYRPITRSYAQGTGAKINYDAWLQRRKDGSGTPSGGRGNDETTVYTPENPLIFSVRVIRRSDFDGIEERSLSDMKMMSEATAKFTKNVEFTALFPQYSRMTDAQRLCYIGFRTEVMNGRYPDVSESYILFLLYELINLTDRYPSAEAVKIICALMREYRNVSDSLFTFMCDWLADLCLINRMDAPLELLEPIRERVYKRATWKEFYVPFRSDTASPDACVLLTAASEYDYRMGKFYSTETAEYFEKHIPAAIGTVIHRVSSTEPAFLGTENDVTTLSHEAFRSAFRSAKNRYTVSIDCACFTRSPLLRQTVTSLVKYAENFVREMLGIRSRLSVSCLGTEKKEAIKEYFAPFVKRESDRPPLKRGRKKRLPDVPIAPEIPEYEKYYEPQSSGFSPELAAKIENDSWHTTDILLTAFSEQTEQEDVHKKLTEQAQTDAPPTVDAVNPHKNAVTEDNTPPPSESSDFISAPPMQSVAIDGLNLLLRGKSREFGELARKNGLLPDTLAEQINEIALDLYGDVAVEGDSFTIIEDYRDELENLASGR